MQEVVFLFQIIQVIECQQMRTTLLQNTKLQVKIHEILPHGFTITPQGLVGCIQGLILDHEILFLVNLLAEILNFLLQILVLPANRLYLCLRQLEMILKLLFPLRETLKFFLKRTINSDGFLCDLVKELQRNGVSFDVRKLNVGDFLRVAREKVAPIPGQLQSPVGRELVLDYIIERKRMDDLCGSIIDGRFREQKNFRLTCPCRELEGDGEDEEEEEERDPLLLPHLLQSSTTCQTVKEVFARQLMQVSGLSGDKAAAILELSALHSVQDYCKRLLIFISNLSSSLNLSLLTAYERCAGEAEKEKLLSSIRYGKLKGS
ncbi:hypothetical protein F7725_001831 [Dissostichus mawsoni]|uniref:Crossover junction endonuclease MUS81 n=1 Tax=Dissostichus mawsoni TaxID=36200 RepID=A0A7J5Y0P2_DISMA|nr:hypothetical protein F7725_001831 [Dissostichus mawsoni]